jgi:hypothetical protein
VRGHQRSVVTAGQQVVGCHEPVAIRLKRLRRLDVQSRIHATQCVVDPHRIPERGLRVRETGGKLQGAFDGLPRDPSSQVLMLREPRDVTEVNDLYGLEGVQQPNEGNREIRCHLTTLDKMREGAHTGLDQTEPEERR